MSQTVAAIRGVKARGVVVPLKRMVRTAFGVIDSGPLVLIDVETDQGVTGRTYIFAYSKLTLHPLCYLIEEIGRELAGRPVAPFDLLAVTPTAHWLEFLDFAGAILARPAEIVEGSVTARGPGLGIEWNEPAVAKYLVS
ncbi:hypothetical protein QMZ05_35440 [Bradyrhizobium sp. INPA03-11B]|uniref:hypothetical protein n=1 Tax=Bradyrhizobium sp. INPA03-11B TaxID=418598 RepID=UPI00338E856E